MFYNGKNILLREHRELKLSQITKNSFPEDRVWYTCTENMSKNRGGGVGQLTIPHKVVHQFKCNSMRKHCHVLITYFSKLPINAQKQDIFYHGPVAKVSANPAAPWFTLVPIRKNMLNKMVKTMCKQGFGGWEENQPFSLSKWHNIVVSSWSS